MAHAAADVAELPASSALADALERLVRWLRRPGTIHVIGATVIAGAIAAGIFIPGEYGGPKHPTPPASGLPPQDVANAYVDTNGGSCTRNATAIAYAGTGDTTSCSTISAAYQIVRCHESILVTTNLPNSQLIPYTVTKTSASAGCAGIASGQGCHLAEPFPNGPTSTDLSACVFVQPWIGGPVTLGVGACAAPCASLDVEAGYMYAKGFTLTANPAKGRDGGLRISSAQPRTSAATCTNYLTKDVVIDTVAGGALFLIGAPADNIGIIRSDFGPSYNNVDVLGIAAQTSPCIYSRTASGGATTSGSTTATATGGNFTSADVGRYLSGTGIPALDPIASVTNSTTVVLTSAATATGSGLTLTLKDSPLHQSTSSQVTRPYMTDSVMHDQLVSLTGQHIACWHFNDGLNFYIARVKFLNCGSLALELQSAENVFVPAIGDGLMEDNVFDHPCSDPNAVPGVSDAFCSITSGGNLAVLCDAPNSVQHLVIRYNSLADSLYGIGEDKGFGTCQGNGWPGPNMHIYGNVLGAITSGFTGYPASYTAGGNVFSSAYTGSLATTDVKAALTTDQLFANTAPRTWDYSLASATYADFVSCAFDLGAPTTDVRSVGRPIGSGCSPGAYER